MKWGSGLSQRPAVEEGGAQGAGVGNIVVTRRSMGKEGHQGTANREWGKGWG